MLENLTKAELEVASKLVFDGLSMAKSSMEQILQSPITLEKVDYSNQLTGQVPRFIPKNREKFHIIKTELKGELKGTSHLIFSEKEVLKLFEACLPAQFLHDKSPEAEMMKMGFLTEIDNMVAAAVITEFSNFLGLEIYGDVPSLQVVSGDDVNPYLEKESEDLNEIIHFKARFNGIELDISPDFIWIINEQFVEKIRQVV